MVCVAFSRRVIVEILIGHIHCKYVDPCYLILIKTNLQMYKMEKSGNRTPIRMTSRVCSNMFLRRKPGKPSYQIEANSCCTFGCATN